MTINVANESNDIIKSNKIYLEDKSSAGHGVMTHELMELCWGTSRGKTCVTSMAARERHEHEKFNFMEHARATL